tara:strand:- start:24 stop:428 length:405 start_codon:yes stop_codon:yes gene_type:complete
MHKLFDAIKTLDDSHLKACSAYIDLLIKLNKVTNTIESTHAEESAQFMTELNSRGFSLPAKRIGAKRGPKPNPNNTSGIVRSVLQEHGTLAKLKLLEIVQEKFPEVSRSMLIGRINSVSGIEKHEGFWKLAPKR